MDQKMNVINDKGGMPVSPKVRKAVIPAAGFGTRLFPATKAVKKELFPIIGRDGIAKPAILYIVEEALDAGVDEVIIIVQEPDLAEFKAFFNEQTTVENFNKLSRPSQEYALRILEIGRRVKFAIQDRQEGFGHAVFAAREAVGGEPFLLLLGDNISRSDGPMSCSAQLLAAFQKHGVNILGLRRTPEAGLVKFGTVSGVWIEENRLLQVTEFVEKPTVDYARRNLRVPGLPESEYLTVFGQYIIKPEIFDILAENIANNVRERGEFQLTSALDCLRRTDELMGLMMDGRRFDIGQPDSYLETLQAFRKG